jgi:hypothetical protein
VQQQTPLEMPPGRAQRLGVFRERLGVPLNPLQHTIREHDLLTPNRR